MASSEYTSGQLYPQPGDDYYTCMNKFFILIGMIHSGAVAPLPTA